MPHTQESAETTALSRELADFLVELSTALHKYTMYPDGHPLLETAVSGVARRLKPILAERPTFAIGVARDHLMIDGVASDTASSVLRELSGKLYRREIGGVRILEGVEDAELTAMLKAVARDGAKGRASAPVRGAAGGAGARGGGARMAARAAAAALLRPARAHRRRGEGRRTRSTPTRDEPALDAAREVRRQRRARRRHRGRGGAARGSARLRRPRRQAHRRSRLRQGDLLPLRLRSSTRSA